MQHFIDCRKLHCYMLKVINVTFFFVGLLKITVFKRGVKKQLVWLFRERAPEIMLACHEYSYPIDVWSKSRTQSSCYFVTVFVVLARRCLIIHSFVPLLSCPCFCFSGVGCIFAELILRKPLFPGDDYIDQVRRRLGFLPLCLYCFFIDMTDRSRIYHLPPRS